ncbi:MAG TPA: HupE/UreJ family protein [Alphaproteobacteria bacterium]|jgi:urease accessory protein
MKALPLAAALLLACAVPAAAHTVTEGTSGFTDGLQHPFGIPAHMMTILGLGLLLGQRDLATLRGPIYGFLAGLVGGLVLSPFLTTDVMTAGLSATQLALVAVLGGLIAMSRPLPLALLATLGVIGGAVLGLDSAPDGATLQQTAACLAGTAIALILVLLNLVALANYAMAQAARHPWMSVGMRIVGSWIVAASLMVLALHLRNSF